MTMGTGIVMMVIGAILVFAINIELEAVNLDLIGYILMGAGALVFILGLIFMSMRRSRDAIEPIE